MTFSSMSLKEQLWTLVILSGVLVIYGIGHLIYKHKERKKSANNRSLIQKKDEAPSKQNVVHFHNKNINE